MQASARPPGGSRERILAAAKALMAKEGYEATTTAAIARAAGTSESQLVRYFEHKPGLLQAVFEEAWTPLNTRVAEAIRRAGSALEAVLAILSLFLTALQADPELAALMMFEGRRLRSHDGEIHLSTGFTQFEQTLIGLIHKCQEEGSFDPDLNAAAVLAAIVGLAEGMLRSRMIQRRSGLEVTFGPDDIRRVFTAMLSGLRTHGR